ncbi:MAG: hypothetical protein K2K97_02600 [Muribaculaceae bacterium]|nr:hypothetical protein [Muribaculaceae bacterium]
MTKLKIFISTLVLLFSAPVWAQTLDTDALASFPSAVQRDVFEVSSQVKLTADQQVLLAKAIEQENDKMIEAIKANDGVLTTKGRNQIAKMRDKSIQSILSTDQQEQYYRGIYNAAADAAGNALADALQKKYDLTDQNWKFIRVAWYKYNLDSRVIRKMLADQPKKADKKCAELKQYWLDTIEAKGGIRVDPDAMTVTVTRPFDPNALHR